MATVRAAYYCLTPSYYLPLAVRMMCTSLTRLDLSTVSQTTSSIQRILQCHIMSRLYTLWKQFYSHIAVRMWTCCFLWTVQHRALTDKSENSAYSPTGSWPFGKLHVGYGSEHVQDLIAVSGMWVIPICQLTHALSSYIWSISSAPGIMSHGGSRGMGWPGVTTTWLQTLHIPHRPQPLSLWTRQWSQWSCRVTL